MEFIIALAMKFWQWTLVIAFIIIGFLINILDKRKPNKLKFLDKLMPLAVARDPLRPEKFPGAWLMKICDIFSNLRLFSLKKSKICFINKSLLDLLFCKILLNVLF